MLIPKPLILIARLKPKEPEVEEYVEGGEEMKMIKQEKKEEEKVGLLEDFD